MTRTTLPGMLHHAQAIALRRAAVATAALAATVAAHHAATGHTALYAGTPALWAGFVAIATLLGPRAGRFRPRHPAVFLAMLVIAQLAAHAVLAQAPWALGLAGYPGAPAIGLAAVVAHAGAAVVLAVLLTGIDGVLAALCGTARRLVGLFRAARGTGAPRRASRRPVPDLRRRSATVPVRSPRGPPVVVVA